MKVRVQPHGYTVVEVMIFLAISAALFVSATLLVSGQQARTQFAQAVREVDSQLQDVINDVSTGYYANTGNFQCSAPPDSSPPYTPPTISSGTNSQGANNGCIFIGRAIQFAVQGTGGEGLHIYNVVGRQRIGPAGAEKEVKDFSEARPTAIAPSISNAAMPSAIDARTLSGGLRASSMRYSDGGPSLDIGAVGFLSGFGQYAASGANLVSGAQRVDLVPVPGSSLGQASEGAVEEINKITGGTANPSGGVVICFDSGGTRQYGEITIGGNGRSLSTNVEIKAGSCP